MESLVLTPPAGPDTLDGSCMPIKGCEGSLGGAETVLVEEGGLADVVEEPVSRSMAGWGDCFLAEVELVPVSSDMRLEPLVLVEEGVGFRGWGEGERPVPAGRGTEIT